LDAAVKAAVDAALKVTQWLNYCFKQL
jgi:hypothetical protein